MVHRIEKFIVSEQKGAEYARRRKDHDNILID